MNINRNDMQRIKQTVIRSENTPEGEVTGGYSRRGLRYAVPEWAYNNTGYVLQPGYIVEVTDYDPTTNKYTIRRPSADGLANIAVVKTYAANSSTAKVELQFSGAVYLWYSSTAPTVADTVGSEKDSFNSKIGATGFAPLETGATVGGSGRCRARFFNAGENRVQYWVSGTNKQNGEMFETWNYVPGTSGIQVETGIKSLLYPINLISGKKYAFSGFYVNVNKFLSDYSDSPEILSITIAFKLYLYDNNDTQIQILTKSANCGGYGTRSTLPFAGSFGFDYTSVVGDKTITKYKWSATVSARNEILINGSSVYFSAGSYNPYSVVVQLD